MEIAVTPEQKRKMPNQMKRNIVVDREMKGRNKRKSFTKGNRDETLLQQQRRTEKELLKQWKDNRASEKKTKIIMRKQSRDVRAGEKECFNPLDGAIDEETHYVWKNDGRHTKYVPDDCKQWIVDYLLSP